MAKIVVLFVFTVIFFAKTACSEEIYKTNAVIKTENDTVILNDTSESTTVKQNLNSMDIKIGNKILTATLVDNSSVKALKEALSKAPITIEMHDYGNMEKVGSLGQNFPRNDESITTEAGDIILYQGNSLVIYYAPNSWSFTRIGKINNISPKELKDILGKGNVIVTLSLPNN